MRSLMASGCSGSSNAGTSTNSTATPDVSPLAAVSYSTLDSSTSAAPMTSSDDGSSSSSAASAPQANPLVDPFQAKFRLEAQNMSDTTITTIGVNQDFQLAAYVEDLRTPPLPLSGTGLQQNGLWAAFMNVSYDSALASITATAHAAGTPDPAFEFGSYFFNDGSSVRTGDVSTPGQIVGAGASSLRSVGSGTGPVLLWRITVHAGSTAGTADFAPSFYETLDDVSTFIISNPADPVDLDVAEGDIEFVPLSLEILADPPPALTVADILHTEADTNQRFYFFVATLSEASDTEITVPFATSDGTATLANNDYQATSGILTFTPGQTSKTITVFSNGDLLDEPDETFNLNLTPSANVTLDRTTIIGTIQNDDPAPELVVTGGGAKDEGDGVINAGDSATTDFVFTVSLTFASGKQITVDFTTTNGSATVTNDDYVGQSGQLVFEPTQTVKLVTVAVNGDTKNEIDETFNLVLSNPSNAFLSTGSIGNPFGQGLILNDDTPPSISIGDVSQAEGDAGTTNFVFPVTLSALSGQTVTVAYATANGTANAPSDYVATSGTVTFLPGIGSQNITVQVKGDNLVETGGPETFFINLSNVSATATILDGQGLGQIQSETSDGVAFTASSISGFAFSDVDNNKGMETGEELIPDVTVTLSGTSSISGAVPNRQTETDANGKYTFGDLEPGTYNVIFTQPPGWNPATPVKGTSIEVALADNNALGFKFTIGELGGVDAVNNHLSVPGWTPDRISLRAYTVSARGAAASSAASALVSASALSMRSSVASLTSTAQITQNGSTVTVLGTNGDDHFEFVAGATHAITINGVTRTYNPASVTKFVFEGGAGQDTAALTGSNGAEAADLSIGSGTLVGANFEVTVGSVSSLSVDGGGGTDSATLHDSALSDHLEAEGSALSMSNELGDITSILAFEQVQANSTSGGTDTASVGSIDFALNQQGDWVAG